MTTKSAKPENRVALLEVQATLSAKKQAKNSDEDDIFASTRNVIADWVQSLFDIDASVLGEQKVSADDRHITVSASDTLWTCYASYPAPDGSGRTWITEVSLEQKPKSPESVTLSLSQSTLQPANERRMPQPLYPEFLGRLAADFTMTDGRFPLTQQVTLINNQTSANKLATFLKNEQGTRNQPAVVITVPELDTSDYGSSDALDEYPRAQAVATGIASHAAGATHVFLLSHNHHGIVKRELKDQNFKPGQIQVFPAHHAPDDAFSFKSIADDDQRNGWKGFIQHLNSRIGKVSCKNHLTPSPVFTQAHNKIKAALPDEDYAVTIDETLNKLVKIAGHLNKIEAAKVQGAEQDSEELGKELKSYIAELQKLQTTDRDGELAGEFEENMDKAKKLRKHFVATSYGITKPYEEKYEALSAWVDEHYGDQVVLSNAVESAFSNPKVRKYGDVNLVYAVVELLATHYHHMKTTTGKAHQYHQGMFKERLKELHVEETATFSSEISKEGLRKDYTVTVEGKKHLLDRHVKRGGPNRDPEEHLRLYFAWDDKRRRVVIGHGTNHKDNSLT